MDKYCPHCKKTLPTSSFNSNTGRADKCQAICRICQRTRDTKYYRNNKNRRDNIRTRHNRYRERNRVYIGELLALGGCQEIGCNVHDPDMLCFHHNDPAKKELGISQAVGYYISLDKLKAEVAKCTIYCLNHHAKLHANLRKVAKP